MATPRAKIVDADNPGVYHCFSKCARGLLLCGGDHEHRRAWVAVASTASSRYDRRRRAKFGRIGHRQQTASAMPERRCGPSKAVSNRGHSRTASACSHNGPPRRVAVRANAPARATTAAPANSSPVA